MEKIIKFRKKLGSKNKGIILSLPNELVDWLELSVGQEIILTPDEGKYGKFIAIFTEKTGEPNDPDSYSTE